MSNIPLSPPSPYVTPSQASPIGGQGAAVSPSTVEQLRRTRGWTMFLGVLSLIGSALFVLILGGFTVVGLIGNGGFSRFNSPEFYETIGGLIVSAAMSLVSIIPAVRLVQFSKSVKNLQASMSLDDLDLALNAQRSFWKFLGILTMVMMLLYGLLIVGLIVAGISAAAQ